MVLKNKEIPGAVAAIAAPLAAELGLTLWDVVYRKEGASQVLRLVIDRPGGVFIEDCENLSRAVDPLLDELEFAGGEYSFEVSSPGFMRELRTDAHLAAYRGKPVVLRLYKPDENGNKEYRGALADFDGESLSVEADGNIVKLSRKDVAGAKADDDADIGGKRK